MATIKDVAKMAGVSVCTVYRAIAGKGYIGQETYDRVMKAVEELSLIHIFHADLPSDRAEPGND